MKKSKKRRMKKIKEIDETKETDEANETKYETGILREIEKKVRREYRLDHEKFINREQSRAKKEYGVL